MALQVTIFRRTGGVIGEIRPHVSEVTWRLNDFGRVKFELATSDDRATEEYLRFGNRILIEFDNGLPNWGGVIDVPRDWRGGMVECTAYGGEYLLMLRQTDKGRYFRTTPVGTIASKLVTEANAIRDSGLTVGTTWPSGDLHSPEYHLKNLYDIFTQSLFDRLSTAEFDVIPSRSDENNIVFTLNVYERKGSDKPDIALKEGFNVTDDTVLSEQGPIYNSINVVGDGQDWGDNRPVYSAFNQDSIDFYGLREYSIIQNGNTNPLSLQAIADTAATKNANPHNLLSISATNDTPGTFSQYDIGDSVTAELPSYGFGGFRASVHVLGRTFYPDDGVCQLVVQEDTD